MFRVGGAFEPGAVDHSPVPAIDVPIDTQAKEIITPTESDRAIVSADVRVRIAMAAALRGRATGKILIPSRSGRHAGGVAEICRH
jgi:hypothetical protein